MIVILEREKIKIRKEYNNKIQSRLLRSTIQT